MTSLFKKMNFKNQKEILILNSPTEFESELKSMKAFSKVKTKSEDCVAIEFVLCFVQNKKEVEHLYKEINKKIIDDGVLWFCYPKKTSKLYRAEIGRDSGWDVLYSNGFDTVRAVAIDDNWSGLRFRQTKYKKSQ